MSGSMLYPQAKLITPSDLLPIKKHCFSVVYNQSQNANANNCKTNQALIIYYKFQDEKDKLSSM